jgi:tRNA 2-thiouridine synthesizing protein A
MTNKVSNTEGSTSFDAEWYAGDLGCGDLVLELRGKLLAMPGKVLKLVARDPGAPADIPAYCRMTGHQLLRDEPDSGSFWIKARTNP